MNIYFTLCVFAEIFGGFGEKYLAPGESLEFSALSQPRVSACTTQKSARRGVGGPGAIKKL
jgi:hypothetical protein